MKKPPIRIRLAAIYGAVFCLSTILLEIGAYAGLRSSMYAVVDSDLQARMSGIVGFLDEHLGRRTLPMLQLELASHAALKPEFLKIDKVGEGPIYRGRWMTGLPELRAAAHSPMFWTAYQINAPVRLLSDQHKIKNHEYALVLGSDFTVPAEILRRFGWLVFLSSPVVFACAALAGYSVSKRALRPVSRLASIARSIGAANLGERVAVPDTGDELQDLAETLNGMLSRIEDAFRHVTQFTANASHELRTPLALIRATSEVALLRTNGTTDHYRKALHRVLREAARNSALLDDMLQLARADSSIGSLTLEPIEFEPHMEEVCERVAPLAQEKGIRLHWRAGEPGLRVMANPEHLKRLWLILLDNAIKYTLPDGTIRVFWRAASTDSLVCEVTDTGIGIAEADLPHIFERFFRADKTRNREEGGAGLGLALARWIVEAHRATIKVESVLGRGSTIRIVLPMPVPLLSAAHLPSSMNADQTTSQTANS
jgi:heavy metal sensor kinase